jgi:predicted HTH domain antitoxin
MSVLTLDLPPRVSSEEARLSLAIQLWEDRRLTLGQAAELAGYSKPALMEILGRRGVPVANYGPDELMKEFEA